MFKAVILGIVQGLTEFLPVSSSGHLEIAKYILKDENAQIVAQESMLMTVVLHFATALATIVVFRREVGKIVMGLLQFKRNEEFDFSVKIILSMIPAVAVGLFFDKQLEKLFEGRLFLVGMMLIVTAVLLLFADRAKKTDKKVSLLDAILIGIAQAIAILPGISRSGATISTSVLLGVDRERAARFSFLMVVPLIFGYIAKALLSGEVNFTSSELMPMLAGFVASFLTGIFACTWMIKLVKNSKLSFFSVYCFIVAVFAIFASFTAAA